MLRTFVVKSETDLPALSSALLDGRFRGAQADAALADLKRLNPHADLTQLKPGTVLFVPDTPGFKATAATSVQAGFLADFRTRLTGALDAAARDAKVGMAGRAAERADVSAALASAVFKNAAANDPILTGQGGAAAKAMAAEETDDKQSLDALAAASRAVLASLDQLEKVLGR